MTVEKIQSDLVATTRGSAFQDRVSALLGCEPAARPELLFSMWTRSPSEATAYWLQLSVAVGIATFGLVLDSTAVVIGAMLIAPLMGPIVSLGMGLAVGSPFLVLRSVGRIVTSVTVAIGAATAITKLLPFSELTAEIAARTTPTALDLFTAAFCALAGAYASMRPGSGTAITAAGTSIGISLVPPLCASGYGVGTAQWNVASGAALLFTANFAAIVVVGTCVFVAAGFNRLDIAQLEEAELERSTDAPIARWLARRLAAVFASPGGPTMRLLMPFLLLAAVYVPLRRALDEVAWQIRVRSAVSAHLAPVLGKVVQSRLHAERGAVQLRLLLVGNEEEADRARDGLTVELTRVAGVKPQIEVVAVPDARALSGLAAQIQGDLAVPVAPPEPPPKPAAQFAGAEKRVHQALEEIWPVAHAGKLAAVWVSMTAGPAVTIGVVHVGDELGGAAREALCAALRASLGANVGLLDLVIPREIMLDPAVPATLTELERAAERARFASGITMCIEEPTAPDARVLAAKHSAFKETIQRAIDRSATIQWTKSSRWAARFVSGTCESKAPQQTAP